MSIVQYGVATTDITPPVGLYLCGYAPRRSTSVGHSLRAEALACDDGTSGWILITSDVVAYSRVFVELVRNDIAAGVGLRPCAVMITAVHTHSGPNTPMAGWKEEPEEVAYFKELRRKLAEVGIQAWKARTPGELLHACTQAPELASNRRVQGPDGTWRNEWNDPNGTHTGYYDPAVELVGVRRPDGTLLALLVNYGCHPVCFNSKNTAVSGDYVSYLKDALERSGQVQTALFTVSGHANIDPKNGVQTELSVVQGIGEALAKIALDALPKLLLVNGTEVTSANEEWIFQTTWQISKDRVGIYFPSCNSGDTVKTEFSGVRAGDFVLVGMPGETVSEYRQMLLQRSPFEVSLLVSLANDFVGYLPTDEILREGAYEAMLSPVQPIQQALLSGVDAVLQKLQMV